MSLRKLFCALMIVTMVLAGTIISYAGRTLDDSLWRVTNFDGSYIEYVIKDGKYTEKYSTGKSTSGSYKWNGNIIKFSDGNQWLVTENQMYHLNSVISNVNVGLTGETISLQKEADNKAFMVEFTSDGTFREYVKLLGKWQLFIEQPYYKAGYNFFILPYWEQMEYDSETGKLYTQIAKRRKNWVTVEYQGIELSFDTDPQIINDRVMVPMRTIFELLGAEVSWDAETKTVTGAYGDTIIKLPIGSNTAVVRGNETTLDSPACIINGRTLVPVRFIAESMGSTVGWNSDTKTVSVSRANPGLKYVDRIKNFLDAYAGYDMQLLEKAYTIVDDYEGFAYVCGSASIHDGKKIIVGTIDNYEPNTIITSFLVKNPEAFDETKTKKYMQGDLSSYSANVVMILYLDGGKAEIVDILYLDDADSIITDAKEFTTELNMSADLRYSDDGKTVYVDVKAEKGSEVTVNGKAVKMSNYYYEDFWKEYVEDTDGYYEYGEYEYVFNEGGSKEFIIEGKRPNKSKKVKLTAEYDVSGPEITVGSLPEQTNESSIIVEGKILSPGAQPRDLADLYGVSVKINGESTHIYSDGSFWEKVNLEEGSNTITIVVRNYYGYTTEETRTIVYTPDSEEN